MLHLYPIVFVSGILTVLSPCVLPILPIILGSGIDGSKKRIHGTIVGLIFSFTFFALALTTIISSLGISADDLRIAAAYILGFFGVSLAIPKVWITIQSKLEKVFHAPAQKQREGFSGGLITGAVLGLVWTPCVGPIIATVTTLAALESLSLGLALLMFTYALGIGLPLLGIAHGGAKVSEKLGWYKKNQAKVRKIFGLIILATALAIGTGVERKFQTWVLNTLPESISNPVGLFEDTLNVDTSGLKDQ